MTFKIDTGSDAPKPYGGMGGPTDGVIDYAARPEHAERKHRQIIEAIEACETEDDIRIVLTDNNEVMDSFYLNYPDYCAAIQDAADGHTIILSAGAVSVAGSGSAPAIPAIAQSTKIEGNRMTFIIDTGAEGGGSQGPFVSWTSEGSARKGLAPESWVLRDKDENDIWGSTAIPAFANGCVMDLDSLQLGWEKDGGQGVAPERRWNPSISQTTARPDESKTPTGKFTWSKAVSVRLAIGDGKAATWEQAAFGAYEAFTRLSKQIMADYPGDGTLPLIKQTGIERMAMKNGSTSIPTLVVDSWVQRPDCLKDDAPVIAAQDPSGTVATTPATPASTESVPASATF